MSKLLKTVTQKAKEAPSLQSIQDVGIKDMPTEIKNQIIYVKDENLLDDEYNMEIYGTEEEEASFVEAIRTNGFKGVIQAYPLGGGKYMIEAGHRRRRHGKSADMLEFPVIVTEVPTSIWQRKRSLVVNNKYNRAEEPMNIAREIKTLIDAHTERIAEYEAAKAKGKKTEQLDASGRPYPTGIQDCVAIDMGITKAQVSQYKQLLELNSELQRCVDEKLCPWSGLYGANKLKLEIQDMLAQSIRDKALKYGAGEVTKEWLQGEVEDLSHLLKAPKSVFDPNDTRYYGEQLKQRLQEDRENRKADELGSISGGDGRKRTRYLGKPIYKKVQELEELLSEEGKIKSKDKENVIAALERMNKLIDTKINELKKGDNCP